jgi:hypothetical protein
VRQIGWYEPQDGSGLQLASSWLAEIRGHPHSGSPAATGIRISNGDMSPAMQTGRAVGIRIMQNTVSWTLKGGITVHNEWRGTGRSGWLLDDIWSA